MASEERRCRLVAIRAVGGQEYNVASLLKSRVESKDSTNVTSIVVLPNFKGFVFVEGAPPYEVQNLAYGIKHFRGLVRGYVDAGEIVRILTRTVEVNVGDLVEVMFGGFKYRGRVVDIDRQSNKVRVELTDAPNPMPVWVSIKYVRKVQQA